GWGHALSSGGSAIGESSLVGDGRTVTTQWDPMGASVARPTAGDKATESPAIRTPEHGEVEGAKVERDKEQDSEENYDAQGVELGDSDDEDEREFGEFAELRGAIELALGQRRREFDGGEIRQALDIFSRPDGGSRSGQALVDAVVEFLVGPSEELPVAGP